MKKIRLTERNLQQLVRRVVNETRILKENKTCGCGVGSSMSDCMVMVDGSNHSGYWDCACCCCILDDASNIRPDDVREPEGFTMGEGYRRRRSNRRR